MYENMPNRNIICIDMKSFYASCIAMIEGLNIEQVPLAVIANFQQPGSVVLAASPAMKRRFRIKTGNRRFEIPNHPDIRLFEPKMDFFLKMSMAITQLIAKYVPPEAIHVYSVDESFVDLTGTEKLYGPPEEAAKMIQYYILEQFNIKSSIGMGPNMLMAKLALDLEAKKTGFARWTYEDIPKKLWPIKNLSDVWGIGRRTESNLNDCGIFSMYDLAHTNVETLEKRFGILGNQLYYHAWGIDLSTLGEPMMSGQISFGKGQMLMRDYKTRAEIAVIILEMCEDVMRRTREAGFIGRTVSLGLSYSEKADTKGFLRSLTLSEPTNETMIMYKACLQLFDMHFADRPARQVTVRFSNLEPATSVQLDLFDPKKEQRHILGHTMDAIRHKFGSTSLLRAVSFTTNGTARNRERLVGGHLK